jgi:hypothetical protein
MTRKASHEAIMLCTESLFEIPEFQALPADRFLLETSVPGIFAVGGCAIGVSEASGFECG